MTYAKAKEARLLARKIYNQLRQDRLWAYKDPSHLAVEALKRTETELGLSDECLTFGVESFADWRGHNTVYHLNTGDSYTTTVCFLASAERFTISAYGDIIEAHPKLYR